MILSKENIRWLQDRGYYLRYLKWDGHKGECEAGGADEVFYISGHIGTTPHAVVDFRMKGPARNMTHLEVAHLLQARSQPEPAKEDNSYGIIGVNGGVVWGFTKAEALKEIEERAAAYTEEQVAVRRVASAKLVVPSPRVEIIMVEGE